MLASLYMRATIYVIAHIRRHERPPASSFFMPFLSSRSLHFTMRRADIFATRPESIPLSPLAYAKEVFVYALR